MVVDDKGQTQSSAGSVTCPFRDAVSSQPCVSPASSSTQGRACTSEVAELCKVVYAVSTMVSSQEIRIATSALARILAYVSDHKFVQKQEIISRGIVLVLCTGQVFGNHRTFASLCTPALCIYVCSVRGVSL